MSSGKTEAAHWHSGIERRSTATPGSILVEIHSSRMDASCEVIEDGESIFHCLYVLFSVEYENVLQS